MPTDATLAVFFSDDGDLGFHMELCNEDTLGAAVLKNMFGNDPGASDRLEADGIVGELQESGAVDFEDGWIALRIGMADATEFLMNSLLEAKSEEKHADQERFMELQRREAADERYEALRSVLVSALGDKASEVVAAAA